MTVRTMVLEEIHRPYPKKMGGEGIESGLSVRDLSTDGPRCENNFTYNWAKGERDKYTGKLRDRIIVIGISRISAAFGGVFRAEGQILSVEGPDPLNGSASTTTTPAPVKKP